MARSFWVLFTWILTAWSLAHAAAPSFTRDVGPLLLKHCAECHNPSDLKGDLDLTRSQSALTSLKPGDLNGSELWAQIESGDMPKKRPPLTAAEKEIIRQWIVSGAKWEGGDLDPLAVSTERRAGYDWWSLQAIKPVEIPKVKNSTWGRNEVDAFILARLEAAGLSPAPEADRKTLIRRLSFDLTGLPPTPEEITAFVNDPDPKAYDRLVERLLASPHYGERWARHWLDVIRFGESQGFERNLVRENAWRFRDWVIQAFNRDLPYDEFVRSQIAGDVLHPESLDALIATGYHVCGTWDMVGQNEGSQAMRAVAREEHREDLVATLSQTFLALTVNCARCHDHKFDPISQREYYQLAALLGGVWQQEKEVSGIARKEPGLDALRVKDAELAAAEAKLREKASAGKGMAGLLAGWEFSADGKKVAASYGPELKPGKTPPWSTEKAPAQVISGIKQSGELTVEAWITPGNASQSGPARLVTISKDANTRNFTLGQDGGKWAIRLRTNKTSPNGLPGVDGGTVTTKRTYVAFTFRTRTGVGELFVDGAKVAEKRIGGDLSTWEDGFRLGLGDELSGARPWKGTFHRVVIFGQALTAEEIARHAKTPPTGLQPMETPEAIAKRLGGPEAETWRRLRAEVDAAGAGAPGRDFAGVAHVINPLKPPVFHVLSRGDVTKPGDEVLPSGLGHLRGFSGDLGLKSNATDGERRAALARWLTDPANPLPARVWVNRLWHYHFGAGLVPTPSDFGFNGGRPSHPELLDYLAAKFVAGGWRAKEFHRLLVTSAAYRQASNVVNAKAAGMDAEGRLLWRFPSRRLEGEAVRDTMLSVSGALNPALGGPSFHDVAFTLSYNKNHTFGDPSGEFDAESNRRTIYRLWARSGGSPMLEALDCPDPSVMTPRRSRTITPLQALSMLNNRFVEQCAGSLRDRVKREAGEDWERQVGRMYELVLGRAASAAEVTRGMEFAREFGVEQLGIVLFNTNEFVLVE